MCTVLTAGGAVALGRVAVLKFGSSLLADAAGFDAAASEIVRERAAGHRVRVVVSAMRGTTDRLLAEAKRLSAAPAGALVSMLLKTGEDASVALLAIALTSLGVNTHALPSGALGLTTRGPIDDAEPIGVDLTRLVGSLRTHDVVVVPGFAGEDANGTPSLLGRGGSDLTALYLAAELGAEEVRLVKDVDGVHPWDPHDPARPSRPLESASWSEVELMGNGVVQPKALRFAERLGIRFRVAAPGGRGTWVGPSAHVP